MPRFQILLAERQGGRSPTRFSADAPHWMAALHLCLEEMETPWAIGNALCALDDDGTVRLTDVEGRQAIIRAVKADDPSRRGPPTAFEAAQARWLGRLPTLDSMPAAGLAPPAEEDDRALRAIADSLDRLDPDANDTMSLLELATRMIWEHLRCDSVQCLVAEEGTDAWQVVAARGDLSSELLHGTIRFADTPLASLAPFSGRPLQVEVPRSRLRFVARAGTPRFLAVDQLLIVPVEDGQGPCALLTVGCRDPHTHVGRVLVTGATLLGTRLGNALARRRER
ncbi:MAG: hypothetical protein H6744_11330 [Deltaproteobacteria bacterium]|nr:hypothetical protein [Deltaproteobacteria bacterium]MCB9787273.1 hypothetical protein [Deltaproteobacteria bacterium]